MTDELSLSIFVIEAARKPLIAIAAEKYQEPEAFCGRHDCSDCFRLERLPDGACTHRKAPPLHGARQNRTHAAAKKRYLLDHPVGALTSVTGTVNPSAFAVLRLSGNSNLAA